MRSRRALVLSAIVVLGYAGGVRAQPVPEALPASSVAIACAPALAPMLDPKAAPVDALRIVGAQDTWPRSLDRKSVV